MAVRVIRARNTDPVVTSPLAITKAAAYCRVSTDSDEQETSYEAQVNHYTSFIQSHPGWELAGIFADEGLSGTQAKTRPQFNALIAACEEGAVNLVITKSISRFARNTLDALNYIRKLKALNIPIIFEKESVNTLEASGELMVTILASIAQQESASISQNVRMGINFGFQEGRGRVNFSSFLGYRKGDKPGTYEIVPAEADVVRRIYRQYLEGFSPKMIADGLMEDGVCTPSGGEHWYPSTVANILENEKYAGDLLMQKWYVEDYLTHKCVKNSGEKPQYFVEDDHDPIVPKAVFYQVQGEKKRRSGLAKDPSKLRFGNRLALNGRLICGKCGRTLKRYVKTDEELTDWRCRQRALVKKTDFHENVESRCDCRIVREVEVQRAVVMAFNELPRRREELVVAQERMITGEIGRIDALLKTIDEQQDSLEERLEVLAEAVPEDEEAINTTVVDEVGSERAVTGDMNEVEFLRARIVELRRRKDMLYAERAEHANTEVQIRLLLELVDEMVKDSLPEWMQTHASSDGRKKDGVVITGGSANGGGGVQETEADGSCRDYDDFFSRTKYTVPEGVLDENGRMERFNNDLVIRYLDRVIVKDDGYEVIFKAGVTVEVEI
ncbi:MAG: recombinase family protein [Oribacterium sp.]|nr:recombinase family protein [Oribacterium sp.]